MEGTGSQEILTGKMAACTISNTLLATPAIRWEEEADGGCSLQGEILVAGLSAVVN